MNTIELTRKDIDTAIAMFVKVKYGLEAQALKYKFEHESSETIDVEIETSLFGATCLVAPEQTLRN